MHILGTHHCGKELRDAFKRRGNSHDALCHSYYAEWVVSIFSYQIQSDYYVGKRSVYIEFITLEHYSVSHHSSSFLVSDCVLRHPVLHYFCLVTANSMSQTHPHKVNSLLNSFRTEHYCFLA